MSEVEAVMAAIAVAVWVAFLCMVPISIGDVWRSFKRWGLTLGATTWGKR